MTITPGQIFILIIGSIIIIAVIAFIVIKAVKSLQRPEMYGMSREEIQKRWQQIEDLIKRNDEMSYKLAVMEADKLLDYALKSRFMQGNTLGERLKLAVYKYPKLRNVWSAHIIRNRLVHEASYHLDGGTARRAIGQFKEALRELGTL